MNYAVKLGTIYVRSDEAITDDERRMAADALAALKRRPVKLTLPSGKRVEVTENLEP